MINKSAIKNSNTITRYLFLSIVSSVLLLAPVGVIAAPGGGLLKQTYDAMDAAAVGDLYTSKMYIQGLIQEVKYSNSLQQPTLIKMLRKSKRTINGGNLGPKEKKTVVVDFLSTVMGILIGDIAKPGVTKRELQVSLWHLRTARLVSKAGYTGKMASSLVQAKKVLKKHSYAPAIQKSIQLVNKAKRTLNSQQGTVVKLKKAKQFTNQAIQTIRNSKIFKNSGGSGGPIGGPGNPGRPGGGGFF